MKRYIAALTVLVFMLFAAPAAAAADTLPPYENAEGYVLMEASTQSVLSGKSHSQRIERAVAFRLGYKSWNDMVTELREKAA